MNPYSKKKSNYIFNAIIEALKSNCRCKHGCIIVKNNKIVGRGFNKALGEGTGLKTHHAERMAILNCDKKNLNGADLYVIRLNMYNFCKYKIINNQNYIMIFQKIKLSNIIMISKPCKRCDAMIKKYMNKYKIRNIYYSI